MWLGVARAEEEVLLLLLRLEVMRTVTPRETGVIELRIRIVTKAHE